MLRMYKNEKYMREGKGRWRNRIGEREGRAERESVRDTGMTEVSIPRAIRPGVSGASTIPAPPSTTLTTLITRRPVRPRVPRSSLRIAFP